MTRRAACIGVLLGVAGCGGSGALPPPPQVATPRPSQPSPGSPLPAAAAPRASIRLGPSLLHYVISRRVDIRQTIQSQETSSQLAYQVFATATIRGPADSAGYPTTFRVDSIVPDSGTVLPISINLAAARGLTFTGGLRSDGEFRGATPSDSGVAQALGQLVGTFRDFYPHVPKTGLTLGATWTDTVSRADRIGALDRLSLTAITTSHAAAIVERDATHSLQIESTATVSLSGDGSQAGQPITLQGTGSRHSVEFMAIDGRYLGGESLDSTSLTFNFPGQTVPLRQVSHAVVRVLP